MKKADSMSVIKKLYLSLVPVQSLAIGLPAINTLLSSIIIGKFLGENALAAIGFAGPLLLAINAAARIFSGGTQIIAGKAIGRGDRLRLLSVFNTSIVISTLFAVICGILCFVFRGELAVLQGAVGDNAGITADFISGLSVGMGFSALSACLFIFLQLERMDKFSTVLSAIMMLVNVGGNAVNVLFLDMGLFGAGLFLSLSNIVPIIIALPYLLVKGKIFRLAIRTFKWREAWELIRLGSPSAVLNITCVVRNRVMNHYVYLLGGNAAMAALSIAGNLSTAFASVVQSGYSGSCDIISGMLIGQRDVKSLRKMSEMMAKSAGWMYIVAYIIIFAIAKPFSLLMGAAEADIATYVLVIRLFNLWCFTNIIIEPQRELYRMQGKIGFFCLLLTVANAVVPCTVTALFSQSLGLWFPVSSPWIAELVTFVILVVVFMIKAKRFPRLPFELCYIPSSLSVERENRYDAEITTVEEAINASKGAVEFCRSKKLDSKLAYYAGLCIEELAVDAVNNRLKKGKNTLDIRMIYEGGHIFIMFRDDSADFDPNEWLTLCRPEDESRSIGIRAVSRLADRMEYVNTLGLNVLTVQL